MPAHLQNPIVDVIDQMLRKGWRLVHKAVELTSCHMEGFPLYQSGGYSISGAMLSQAGSHRFTRKEHSVLGNIEAKSCL